MGKNDRLCPKHNVPLIKKRVVYGLMDDEYIKAGKCDDVILGGCIVMPGRRYGYKCPVDKKVYYLSANGELEPDDEDEPEYSI